MSEGLKICGERARSKMVGIIYPLVNIGLTDQPKIGGTHAPPTSLEVQMESHQPFLKLTTSNLCTSKEGPRQMELCKKSLDY